MNQPIQELWVDLGLIVAASKVREETRVADGQDLDGVPNRTDLDALDPAAELSVRPNGRTLHVVPL